MRVLRLRRETLRELEVDDLRAVVGADPTPTYGCTVYPTFNDVLSCLSPR